MRNATRHACLNKAVRSLFVYGIEESGVPGLWTEDMRKSRSMRDRCHPFAGFAKHLGIADVSNDRFDTINLGARISIETANLPTCFVG
jgi:hypothetical protein